jgi:choline dehydrogenase-like flavoprotein
MFRRKYDVLIIGSGASGGTAARQLTKNGIHCLMLDAGPAVNFRRDRELRKVYTLPYRGFGQPGRLPHVTQADEYTENVWADEKQNPYTYPADDPYFWVRVRLLGGKSLFWGRASWRLSNFEFKCKDRDGFGENWPIEYVDLAPYYDQAEPMLRVSGRKEGLPQLPDGVFIQDNSPDSETIQRFIQAAKRRNIPTTKQRVATGQLASSINRMLPDALETGKLQIVSNAVVSRITTDRNTGLVDGAIFIDRRSRQEFYAKARVVVVGASCLESTRLLLNSGLANSSGVLGHYLFDQFYVKDVVSCIVPEARGGNPRLGLIGGDGYVPRFRNLDTREKNFLRGYAMDFGSGGSPRPEHLPLYGTELLKALADTRNSGFSMTTMGSVLPRYENCVEIDKSARDAWAIPALHIRAKYSENEFAMAKDSMNVAEELCHDAGFELLAKHWEMVPPGESIHELGTCRMGKDPKTSVLNSWNQSHDIKNLFVIDGSSFVSGGSQNPTLTICALAMRASDYIAAQMRRGDL